ncbi:hypothetical protein N825_24290 [Skermanella stibiiresistens SB22]|uniref:YjiS-like domain-containing protein n=1 Tax=Skermanella stibiiresistens SB22 TaxID=1385369 RepID=W9H619_9PROT|nr:DUF1127 domain-containing protein [Skermanella stibiiresistens]EWY41665.1 hypothetical protein N825_24290 [Skermanella stibiiresistens SB22]
MKVLLASGVGSHLVSSIDPIARLRWIARVIVTVFDTLAEWRERARQRRQLARLSDHMLSDIGISRADVLMEHAKPFWKE